MIKSITQETGTQSKRKTLNINERKKNIPTKIDPKEVCQIDRKEVLDWQNVTWPNFYLNGIAGYLYYL